MRDYRTMPCEKCKRPPAAHAATSHGSKLLHWLKPDLVAHGFVLRPDQ